MKWRLALLFLLIVCATTNLRSAPAQQQRAAANRPEPRVALLIANSNYRDSDVKLTNPVRDARALAEELRRDGFEVVLKENLGKEDMQRTIDQFAATIAPGATALFFFSGYGIQVNRQNFLIPTDARIGPKGTRSRTELTSSGFSVRFTRGAPK